MIEAEEEAEAAALARVLHVASRSVQTLAYAANQLDGRRPEVADRVEKRSEELDEALRTYLAATKAASVVRARSAAAAREAAGVEDPILDTPEAERFLGMQTGTLRYWRTVGRGPAYILPGEKVRGRAYYRRSALEAWIASHTHEPKKKNRKRLTG